MVFGKKCVVCGDNANIHSQELGHGHQVISDRWLCLNCDSAEFDEKMKKLGR